MERCGWNTHHEVNHTVDILSLLGCISLPPYRIASQEVFVSFDIRHQSKLFTNAGSSKYEDSGGTALSLSLSKKTVEKGCSLRAEPASSPGIKG
jgi:hypothetical protein